MLINNHKLKIKFKFKSQNKMRKTKKNRSLSIIYQNYCSNWTSTKYKTFSSDFLQFLQLKSLKMSTNLKISIKKPKIKSNLKLMVKSLSYFKKYSRLLWMMLFLTKYKSKSLRQNNLLKRCLPNKFNISI